MTNDLIYTNASEGCEDEPFKREFFRIKFSMQREYRLCNRLVGDLRRETRENLARHYRVRRYR